MQRPKKKRAKKMQSSIAFEAITSKDDVDLTSAKIGKVAAFGPDHLYEPFCKSQCEAEPAPPDGQPPPPAWNQTVPPDGWSRGADGKLRQTGVTMGEEDLSWASIVTIQATPAPSCTSSIDRVHPVYWSGSARTKYKVPLTSHSIIGEYESESVDVGQRFIKKIFDAVSDSCVKQDPDSTIVQEAVANIVSPNGKPASVNRIQIKTRGNIDYVNVVHKVVAHEAEHARSRAEREAGHA